MISEKLSSFYLALEEKWYKLLDSLDSKGLPVYGYADLFDKRGIPSFLATVVLILFLSVFAFGFLIVSHAEPSVNVSLKDSSTNPLAGVKVTVSGADGRILFQDIVNDNSVLPLKGAKDGELLKFTAEKNGFETNSKNLKVNGIQSILSIELQRESAFIDGSLLLMDSETGDRIENAVVIASWSDQTRQGISDENGLIELKSIPSNESISVKITADSYEEKTDSLSFSEGQVLSVQLNAKNSNVAGNSSLIISVYDRASKNLLKGAKIQLRNKSNDSLITEEIAVDGEFTATLPKGTPLRIIASAEGYSRYDSIESGLDKTLRENEEKIEIELSKGGESLNVTTLSSNGGPLANAIIQLFDFDNKLIDENKTSFSGSIQFSSLPVGKKLTVTAFLVGYLPIREKIDLALQDSVILKLLPVNSSNSALVGVGVSDEKNLAANNADVLFYEFADGILLPAGIPLQKTSIEGFISVRLPVDSNILIKAKRDVEEGEANIKVKQGEANLVRLQIKKPLTLKEITVYDAEGIPVNGRVKISTIDGDVLFDGNVSNGKVYFNSQGNNEANVEIFSKDGKKFSTRINLVDEGKANVTVSGTAADGLAPEIKFNRILDSKNNEVDGIVPGQFYWLEFSIAWPQGTAKGGVHFRTGSDSIQYVDSQEIGIFGFDAFKSKDSFLSTSYHPEPLPGNEGIDRLNKGNSASYNKWLELKFDQPEGESLVKVKVKARENSSGKEFEVHYRAWSVIGNRYYRNPDDKILETGEFSRQKSGLYAETLVEKIQAFESNPSCRETICAAYSFVGEDGTVFPEEDFSPITGTPYAIEISLNSRKTIDNVIIKADTSKTAPKLFLTGTQIENFSTFIDSNKSDTSIAVNDLGLQAGESKNLRIYFRTAREGAAIVKLQFIADKIVLSKELAFNVFQQREMDVLLEPQEILLGKNFTIKVKDSESKAGIANATIKLLDEKNKLVYSIVGNGSVGNGESGEYVFKNSFNLGNYLAEVSAQPYLPKKIPIAIARNGYLQMNGEIKLVVGKNPIAPSATESTELLNNSQNSVQAITYELKKSELFPADIELFAVTPNMLSRGQKGQVQVTARFVGIDRETPLYGEADLIIRGLIDGKYPTSVQSKVLVYYNKQFDSACLIVTPPEIQGYVLGSIGSTAKLDFQVENKCGIPLILKTSIDDKSNDSQLDVSVQPIQLAKDESKKVEVNVLNKIPRASLSAEERDYTVLLESEQVSKAVPLKVLILNPLIAIDAPSQIVLWLSQSRPQEKASAQALLPVKNNSPFDIQNLTFSLKDDFWSKNNIQVSVLPILGIPVLPKNQVLIPPKSIIVQTNSSKSLAQPVFGQIAIEGQVNGIKSLLRTVNVWVNVSGYQCLSIRAPDGLDFSSEISTYGSISKEIIVANNCTEEIIVRGVKPDAFGENSLEIAAIDGELVLPGQEAKFKLLLQKLQDYEIDNKFVSIIGFGPKSGKFIESASLPITVKLGEKASETGLATDSIEVPICGKADNVKSVSFPKISEEDCTQGYCDAKNMANFLLDKSNDLIKKAKSKIIQMSYDSANFPGCNNQESCSFNSMGITSPTITAYLQNDSMASRVLTNQISDGKFDELKGYKADVSTASLADIARTGYTRQLLLTENVKGCGKYLFTINGAAQVISNRIVQDSFVVQIKVESSRKSTPECLNKIENILNFLPLDKDYTSGKDLGTWLGHIESGDRTKDIAKAFSQSLFGTEKRVLQNSSGYNKLKLETGSVADGIIKFSIAQKEATDAPKTINATITEAYNIKETAAESGTKGSENSGNSSTSSTTNASNSTAGNSLNNSSAATANISIADNYFSPGEVTISEGDSIAWKNNGSNTHTVTFDNLSIDSGDLQNNNSFTQTFATAGTYNYHCRHHSMNGKIIVKSKNGGTSNASATANVSILQLQSIPSNTAANSGQVQTTTSNQTAIQPTTQTIIISDSGFSPSTPLTINQNDSIIWKNDSSKDHTIIVESKSQGTTNKTVKSGYSTPPLQFAQTDSVKFYSEKYPQFSGTITVIALPANSGNKTSIDSGNGTAANADATGGNGIAGNEASGTGSNGDSTNANGTSTTTEPQTVREKIAAEAAAALSELSQHEIDGCISENEDYLILKSFSKYGQLVLSGSDSMELAVTENCSQYSVSSELPEKVKLKTSWNPKEPLNGIDEIALRDSSGKEIGKEKILTLQQTGNGKFEYRFNLCVTGNNQFTEAINSKLKIWAASSAITVGKIEKIENIRKSNTKTISFNACGVHPYALYKGLMNTGEGTYYATIGWADASDTVSEDAVLKALNRQQELQKIVKSNSSRSFKLSMQKQYKEFISSEKTKAVGSYLAACVPTSAVCGAVMHFGAGGAVFDTFANCVIPAFVEMSDTFESGKQAKAWLEERWGGFKTLFGNDWAGLMNDTTGDQKAEDLKQLIGTAETAVSIKSLAYLGITATQNIQAGTAAIAAREARDKVANSDSFIKAFSGAPNSVKEEYLGNFETRVRKNLLEHTGDKVNSRFPAAVDDALAKTGEDMGDILAKNATKLKRTKTDLGKLYDSKVNAKMGELFDESIVKAGSGGFSDKTFTVSVPQGATSDEISDIVLRAKANFIEDIRPEEMSKNMVSKLKGNTDLAGATKYSVAEIDSRLQRNLSSRLSNAISQEAAEGGGVKLTLKADDVEKAVATEVDALKTSDYVRGTIGKSVRDGIANDTLGEMAVKADAEVGRNWFARLKQLPRSIFNRETFKAVGKGLACGAVANYAGYAAYNYYVDHSQKEPENTIEFVGGKLNNGVDVNGDGKPDYYTGTGSEPIELRKNTTYKIVVSMVAGNKIISLSPVSSNEQALEMEKELKAGKAKRLDKDYCDGSFANQTLQIVFGSFNPTPEKGATVEEIKTYNDAKIQASLVNAADNIGIDEGLLVTAMFSKKLYTSSDFEETINAEAEKIKQSGFEANCNQNDSDCFLKAYAMKENLNYNELKKTYAKWQKFKTEKPKEITIPGQETKPVQPVQQPATPPANGGQFVPKSQVQQKIVTAANKYGVPADIALGVAMVESSMQHTNANGSVKVRYEPGKYCVASWGIYQLCEPTGKSACSLSKSDLMDLEKNIDCGVKYLKGRYEKCKNWDVAIKAYNSGNCNSSNDGYLSKVNSARKQFQ